MTDRAHHNTANQCFFPPVLTFLLLLVVAVLFGSWLVGTPTKGHA